MCEKKENIGFIGSSFFMGWSATILIVPLLADKIGRRWLFFGGMLVTASTMLTFYLSRSLGLTIAMMVLSGAATSARITCGYVLATEFLTPYW